MLFAVVLALFATSAFAAPQPNIKALENVIDLAIAEIAKAQPKTFNEVDVLINTLKRTSCDLKDGALACIATGEATVNSPDVKDEKVLVKLPIHALLKDNLSFDKIKIFDAEIEEIESESGLFGFWSKVKHALGKAAKTVVKTVGPIVTDAAKAAVQAKASSLATAAVGAIIG